MADRIAYLTRAPGAAPAADFSTIRDAHSFLIARLSALRPHNIRYHADPADLEERADHVRDILGATLDYIAAVIGDSADNCPVGLLKAADVMAIVSDLAGDVSGRLIVAADQLAAGEA